MSFCHILTKVAVKYANRCIFQKDVVSLQRILNVYTYDYPCKL